MSDIALQIENLEVAYGNIKALRGINISVPAGEVVALLGANGAGKTTTLKTISGIVHNQGGKIRFYNQDITSLSSAAITSLGIVQSPEGRQIFPELTVEENLRIGAFTIKKRKQISENYERVFRYFPF